MTVHIGYDADGANEPEEAVSGEAVMDEAIERAADAVDWGWRINTRDDARAAAKRAIKAYLAFRAVLEGTKDERKDGGG